MENNKKEKIKIPKCKWCGEELDNVNGLSLASECVECLDKVQSST